MRDREQGMEETAREVGCVKRERKQVDTVYCVGVCKRERERGRERERREREKREIEKRERCKQKAQKHHLYFLHPRQEAERMRRRYVDGDAVCVLVVPAVAHEHAKGPDLPCGQHCGGIPETLCLRLCLSCLRLRLRCRCRCRRLCARGECTHTHTAGPVGPPLVVPAATDDLLRRRSITHSTHNTHITHITYNTHNTHITHITHTSHITHNTHT